MRRSITLEWVRAEGSERALVLLSHHFDGTHPGVDPHDTVSPDRIDMAAARLGETSDAIRAEYERLVRERGFPLRLPWLKARVPGD